MLPSGLVASHRLAAPKAPNSTDLNTTCPASGDCTPCTAHNFAAPTALKHRCRAECAKILTCVTVSRPWKHAEWWPGLAIREKAMRSSNSPYIGLGVLPTEWFF